MKWRHLLLFLGCFSSVLPARAQEDITVFPNPFDETVTVAIQAEFRDSLTAKLLNINGEENFEIDPMIILHDTVFTIETKLHIGVYILSVEKESRSVAVKLLDKKNSENDKITFKINIDEDLIGNRFELYPNPAANGQFTTGYTDASDQIVLDILDATGKLVRRKIIHKSFGIQEEVDLGEEAKGLYFVRIRSGEKYRTKQILLH